MRVVQLNIENFRGIKKATLFFPKHAVLIGDNNTGKTDVVFEAAQTKDMIGRCL